MPDKTAYLSAVKRPPPHVAILLCTYQGEEFLAEQLDSFAAQTHVNWRVWASDAGSNDDTYAILRSYQKQWGEDKLILMRGPSGGPTQNFMSLVHNSRIEADYYAFSDQDDIWEADKLQRAIAQLERHVDPNHQDNPALYCSRTRYVDADNLDMGLSQCFRKPPGFANALMQNIAGGNTMVFNHSACRLLRSVHPDTDIVIHDWWVYLAVTACGGMVIYDPYPSLRYRQHSGNLIGMNANWAARRSRIRQLFEGRFHRWSDQNITALRQLKDRMTEENRKVLDLYDRARRSGLLPRLAYLAQAGIYRQTVLGNLGVVLAAVFNKL
ncbi:MAG TPA: glycosyltransferase family 2 protein [Candidimonas sp.]|nr:glycosyltransferase family 2 protein [Candidimonas sp.]